ncbi:hypothetical protein GUJ93_ZPchr0012g20251 [Zizania palustris]|uniref:Uncharacterized protein n=1 Tax=Zizania palustris TaxID=103762 RepID=A0A8J5WWZ0_ZIZPA|nr:hypothetical protein GUJ93_ZPchr0012g20251 [Zizania palustris]
MPPSSKEDGAMPVVEEGLVAMDIEEGGGECAPIMVSEEDGVVIVVWEGFGLMGIEEIWEALVATNGVGMVADGGGGCGTDCVEVSQSEDDVVRVFIAELRGLIRKGKWVYLALYSMAEATV